MKNKTSCAARELMFENTWKILGFWILTLRWKNGISVHLWSRSVLNQFLNIQTEKRNFVCSSWIDWKHLRNTWFLDTQFTVHKWNLGTFVVAKYFKPILEHSNWKTKLHVQLVNCLKTPAKYLIFGHILYGRQMESRDICGREVF